MTWQERCQWDWHDSKDYLCDRYKDQVEPGYYHQPEDIVLMSSPKFEAEDGEAEELAQQVRENALSKHKYVNGKGDDLAEEAWKRDHNNGEERQWDYGYRRGHDYDNSWYTIGDVEHKRRQDEARASAKKAYTATRIAFQKDIVWVQTTTT